MLPRYLIDSFHAASLENNPVGSPMERFANIYLPPGYYEERDGRYPVIYLLHGHGGNWRKVTVSNSSDMDKMAGVLPPELLAQIDTTRLPSYARLDELITVGELKPFILVQPDGSLHLPKIDHSKDLISGEPATKGSFYVNSPFTGSFEDYIINDVIGYIDSHYRTAADRSHRAVVGESMGGYGALSLSLHHPNEFAAIAALSPANFTVDHLSWKLRIPILDKLLGAKAGADVSDLWLSDILDTLDLVYSHDAPLIPSVKRDASGAVTSYDPGAATAWARYDLNNMIDSVSSPFKGVSLLLNCDKSDDFGLGGEVVRIHETMVRNHIKHEFDLYSDPATVLSPHMFGIAYHIIPAIRFCSQIISKD